MKVIIDKEFWDLFPDVNIEVLVLKNVKEDKKLNETESKEIKELLDKANQEAKKYLTSDVISENEVVQVWREAYSKFPTKKGARSSIENLLKRVLHDNPVGTIAPSVDITNAISLEYALPIGAENLDSIEGDFHLGVMKGGEEFYPIGSDKEEPPLPGEVAYYDDRGAICRCWNWRDGKRTEVDDDTKNEIIIMECVEPNRIQDMQEAFTKLKELMTKYLDAEVANDELMNKENTEFEVNI